MMFLVWIVSVRKRDVSVVDIFWGLGFVLAGLGLPRLRPRAAIAAAAPRAGARHCLGSEARRVHLLARPRDGEDYRYRTMREAVGGSFWWRSLFTVFVLQGVLVGIISLPLLFVQAGESPAPWRWSDALGLSLWGLGFFFETVGDWQMARFKSDPRIGARCSEAVCGL